MASNGSIVSTNGARLPTGKNVPIHSGKIIKRKTLKAILKDAGLTVEQFRYLKR